MYIDYGFDTDSDISVYTDIATWVKQDLIDQSGCVHMVSQLYINIFGYFIDTGKAILSISVETVITVWYHKTS